MKRIINTRKCEPETVVVAVIPAACRFASWALLALRAAWWFLASRLTGLPLLGGCLRTGLEGSCEGAGGGKRLESLTGPQRARHRRG